MKFIRKSVAIVLAILLFQSLFVNIIPTKSVFASGSEYITYSGKSLANEVLSQMGETANYYNISATNSPWDSYTYINSWGKQNRAYGPFYNSYIMNDTTVYADNFISVFLSKTTPGLYWLNPGSAYGGWVGVHNVAIGFTAPQDGKYSFSADDINDTLAKNFTNKTIRSTEEQITSSANMSVRITVNGQKIWPAATDWQTIAPEASVAIPTISDIIMTSGQELKVEVKANELSTGEYTAQVTASAKMVYTGPVTAYTGKELANQVLSQTGETANNYAISNITSPWNTATYISSWDKQNRGYGPFYNAFIMTSTAVYSDNNISVFLSKTKPGLYYLNPGSIYPGWVGLHNTALSFTVPQDGNYTFSSDDIDDILAKNFTNTSITGTNSNAAAGLRITVNNQKIWPVASDWQIIAPGSSVAIPTLTNLILKAGQEFRIEVKANELASASYQLQVTASAKMVYEGPVTEYSATTLSNQVLTQTGVTVGNYPISNITSPWNTATYISSWDKQNTGYGPFFDAFIMTSTAVYSDNNISVFLSKTKPGLYYLNPGSIIPGWVGLHNTALSFTAPLEGKYIFSSDDINDILAKNFTNTSITGTNSNAAAGVRITVNNQKIWPVASDWQIIAPGSSAAIPTIADIIMSAGQEFRIEVKANELASAAYQLQVTASAKMTYTGPSVQDITPPDLVGSINFTAPDMTSLSITFPTATDNYISKGDINYLVYVSTTAYGNDTPTGTPNKTITGQTGSTVSTSVTQLNPENNYYVAVVAKDTNGNKSFIKAGPFKTTLYPFNVTAKSGKKIVTNVIPNTSVNGFLSQISPIDAQFKFTDYTGKQIYTTEKVGSGTKIEITYDSIVYQYNVVIYGDATGDGTIDVSDLAAVKNHLLKSATLSDELYYAAQMSNTNVTISSLLTVKKHILNISTINQNQ